MANLLPGAAQKLIFTNILIHKGHYRQNFLKKKKRHLEVLLTSQLLQEAERICSSDQYEFHFLEFLRHRK